MKKNSIIISVFFLCIFIFTWFLVRNSVLIDDDLAFTFGSITINKFFNFGSWIMYLQNVLLYVIPYSLDINLQDWCLIVGSLIKAGIVSAIFVYIYKFLRRSNQVNTSIVFTLVLYMIFFILHSRLNFIDFIINEGFFRFLIPSFLMEVFLYYFYLLLGGEKVNLVLLGILAIFTASSSEVASVILISIVGLSILYKSLVQKQKEKSLIYILSLLILGFILLLQTKGFQAHLNDKLHATGLNFNNLSEFIILFFKKIIWDYIVIYAALIILWFKNKKDAIYSCIILIGTFTFFAALFFMGKTHYDGGFWLVHNDLHTFLIMMFITSLVVSIKNINIKLGVIVAVIIFIPFLQTENRLQTTLLNIKNISYIRDKIKVFYEYKGMTPIFPQYVVFYTSYNIQHFKDKINYYKDFNLINYIQNKKQEEYYYDFMNKYYYKYLYNVYPINKNKLILDKEAIEIYKSLGGNLEEVDTGRYRFSDLKNKDFVLGVNKK